MIGGMSFFQYNKRQTQLKSPYPKADLSVVFSFVIVKKAVKSMTCESDSLLRRAEYY